MTDDKPEDMGEELDDDDTEPVTPEEEAADKVGHTNEGIGEWLDGDPDMDEDDDIEDEE